MKEKGLNSFMESNESLVSGDWLHTAIKQLSLYEMFRLLHMLDEEIEDKERVAAVRAQIHVGDRIEWFNRRANKSCMCTILEKRKKTVLALNDDDGLRWTLSYYNLNVSNTKFVPQEPSKHEKLTRQHFSVGEEISFSSNQGKVYYGKITKLNPKNAKVTTHCGERWKVAYCHLTKVITGEIEAEYELLS